MSPKLNEKRALFVLSKIDEILAWEQARKPRRRLAVWNWVGICAKCAQASIGGWRI